VTAGEHVREAWRAIASRPGATLGAIAAHIVAALALSAASAKAVRAIGAAIAADDLELAARALGLLIIGGAFAVLIVDVARMCALSAYAGARGTLEILSRGLARTPALITVRAVELTILGMLAFGAIACVMRLDDEMQPGRASLVAAALLAPVIVVAIITFVAGRVGIALAARGLKPAFALVHGFDFALRRFPSLVRLGLGLFLAAWPFLVAAVALTIAALVVSPRAAALCHALRAGALGAAALWGYAALVGFVGRDARLSAG
jgi:hypothetical protein